MSFNTIQQLHNNAWEYLAKSEELFDINRDEAKKYLNLAKKCRREADELLGITSSRA